MLPRLSLRTPRLILRPTEASDAVRALEIQSNWNVTRNLRMAAFPPDRAETVAWFAGHEAEWMASTAYRFAIVSGGRMMGVIDVDEIAPSTGSLGYWLDESCWGQGFGYEAAGAVVEFAFQDAGLMSLTSGHAADNPASGRILEKVGFRRTGEVFIPSRSRGETIRQVQYRQARQ